MLELTKQNVYNTIINTLANKGITTFTIEKDIVLNNMLSSNKDTLTNNEYITITEEDIQEQQDETAVEENSTMKSLLKIAITESLNNNGLTL